MPARTCSATRLLVKKPRHTIAATNCWANGFIALKALPMPAGSSSGSTKYQKKSCTSSGTLRNIST